MIDYIQTYVDTVAEIEKECTEKTEASRRELVTNKRGAARAAGEQQYYVVASALQRLRDARKAVARAEIAVAGDRFTAWMLENCTSYPEHVDLVLQAMPLDIHGLRKLCADNGWCGEFDRYLDAAIRAGVIDDGRSQERKDFEQWFRSNYSIRETGLAQINEHLDKVVAAEVAALQASKKGAKADA